MITVMGETERIPIIPARSLTSDSQDPRERGLQTARKPLAVTAF